MSEEGQAIVEENGYISVGELEAGLTATVIAQDGIAVIVNNESGITELTSEQVKGIYVGEITTWEELQ